MKCQVFRSEDVDSKDAAVEVINQIETQFGEDPQALIVEVGIDHEHEEILKALNERWPSATIVGGTTDGEIFLGKVQSDTLVVAALHGGKKVQIAGACLDNVTTENYAAKMKSALNGAKDKLKGEIKVALTWVEGLPTFDPAQSMLEFYKCLGKEIPIFGGSVADQLRFKHTKQFYGGRVLNQSIVYLFFAGEVEFAGGIDCGWDPIGEPHVITESEGNVLKKIDGRPVGDVLEQYTGKRNAVENPFAVFEDNGDYYMRSPVAVTPEGWVVFAGSVPTGRKVRFTHATKAMIIEGGSRAVNDIHFSQAPSAIFVFSCTTRRQFLGTQADQELALVAKKYPGVPMVGFYCYGEFGPYKGTKRSIMHNNTLCVLVVAA